RTTVYSRAPQSTLAHHSLLSRTTVYSRAPQSTLAHHSLLSSTYAGNLHCALSQAAPTETAQLGKSDVIQGDIFFFLFSFDSQFCCTLFSRRGISSASTATHDNYPVVDATVIVNFKTRLLGAVDATATTDDSASQKLVMEIVILQCDETESGLSSSLTCTASAQYFVFLRDFTGGSQLLKPEIWTRSTTALSDLVTPVLLLLLPHSRANKFMFWNRFFEKTEKFSRKRRGLGRLSVLSRITSLPATTSLPSQPCLPQLASHHSPACHNQPPITALPATTSLPSQPCLPQPASHHSPACHNQQQQQRFRGLILQMLAAVIGAAAQLYNASAHSCARSCMMQRSCTMRSAHSCVRSSLLQHSRTTLYSCAGSAHSCARSCMLQRSSSITSAAARSYGRRLQQLELICLEQRRLLGQLIDTYQCLYSLNDVTLEGLFDGDNNFVSAHGDVISHVNISSARITDGGLYRCEARNRAGDEIHEARLNVYGPPTVRHIGPLTAVAGANFSVRCPVGGHPIARITWSKDGDELPVSRRQMVSSDGQLTVLQVTAPADSGLYTCTAADRKGHSDSTTFRLTVAVPPRLAPVMMSRGTRAGMPAQATCLVQEGDPPISIVWLKDGRLLRTASSPAAIQQRSLDSRACIWYLLDSDVAGFSITEGAFVSDAKSVTEFEDLLTADAVELPGLHITLLNQMMSLLVIEAAAAEHSGNYTCAASNAARVTYSSALLSVAVPPQWVLEPGDVHVRVGDDVRVPCGARGVPLPSVTWRRLSDNGKYVPVKTIDFSWTRNSASEMPTVRSLSSGFGFPSDSGILVSDSGDTEVTKGARMDQLGKKERNVHQGMTDQPDNSALSQLDNHLAELHFYKNDRLEKDVGAGASLDARAGGRAQGAGSNNNNSNAGVGVLERARNESLLMIHSATRATAGRYICEAVNGVGADLSKLVTVYVNEPPWFPAQQQEVEGVMGDTITLTCRARGDPKPTLTWLPHYISSDPRYQTERMFNASASEQRIKLVLRDASASDSAVLRCEASNIHGKRTAEFVLRVLDVPPPPRGVRVVEKDSRSVSLKWEPVVFPNSSLFTSSTSNTTFIITYTANDGDD
ncbi:Immunoglobulin I-set, partial [Trinorchestia longiramus]